ncbi:MAG: hypothetical protein RQ754_16395 [Desulfuromonadales bacterium]|nr:hypothetical protein [Desulfuromonadales bacterium]
MAGSLTGTPYRDEFFKYLRTKGGLTSDNSAKSYISYINNLCHNMAKHGTNRAGAHTALDVLMEMARKAFLNDDYIRDLWKPLQGPKGRPQDLQSAAMQMFHFARNHTKGGKGISAAPKQTNASSAEITALPTTTREIEPPVKVGEFIFRKTHWLRNPPDEEIIKAVDEFFELLAVGTPGTLINAKGRDFDGGIREALLSAGCTSVSELDTQKVFPGANYTFDITATTPDGIRLLIEIEKTEVKRIIHDILKIAAGQRRDPKAIGLLLVPDRYRTGEREFARTHLQEATAMMELLDYAHPWGGQSIGVVVYEAR